MSFTVVYQRLASIDAGVFVCAESLDVGRYVAVEIHNMRLGIAYHDAEVG